MGVSTFILAATALWLAGCATSSNTAKAGPTELSNKSAAATPQGAKYWAQNCGHCHNIRSPGSYADAQWEVVSLHMRVRANLTAEESKAILVFLKSAH